MADPRARPGQPRNRHKERLARPEYERLRDALAAAMELQGMSQRELSAKLRMPSTFINKVMAGVRPLEVTELIDIANALSLAPEELVRACLETGQVTD